MAETKSDGQDVATTGGQSGEPKRIDGYNVPGWDGQIRLTRKRVIITRRGAVGFLVQGLAGDREVPISSITAVQFKPAGITSGFLKLTVAGSRSDQKAGLFAAASDENAVTFTSAQEPHFREVKRYIDSVIDEVPVPFESLNLPTPDMALVTQPAAFSTSAPAVVQTVPGTATVQITASIKAIETQAPPKKGAMEMGCAVILGFGVLMGRNLSTTLRQ
jgi:hypothetical protein